MARNRNRMQQTEMPIVTGCRQSGVLGADTTFEVGFEVGGRKRYQPYRRPVMTRKLRPTQNKASKKPSEKTATRKMKTKTTAVNVAPARERGHHANGRIGDGVSRGGRGSATVGGGGCVGATDDSSSAPIDLMAVAGCCGGATSSNRRFPHCEQKEAPAGAWAPHLVQKIDEVGEAILICRMETGVFLFRNIGKQTFHKRNGVRRSVLVCRQPQLTSTANSRPSSRSSAGRCRMPNSRRRRGSPHPHYSDWRIVSRASPSLGCMD